MEARRPLSLLAAAAVTLLALWAYASQPRRPLPFVPIQDGRTIDFSSGTPSIRGGPEEKASIDATVKKMDAASESVTFPADGQKGK